MISNTRLPTSLPKPLALRKRAYEKLAAACLSLSGKKKLQQRENVLRKQVHTGIAKLHAYVASGDAFSADLERFELKKPVCRLRITSSALRANAELPARWSQIAPEKGPRYLSVQIALIQSWLGALDGWQKKSRS